MAELKPGGWGGQRDGEEVGWWWFWGHYYLFLVFCVRLVVVDVVVGLVVVWVILEVGGWMVDRLVDGGWVRGCLSECLCDEGEFCLCRGETVAVGSWLCVVRLSRWVA